MSIFPHSDLYMSLKSSTFAPDLMLMKMNRTLHTALGMVLLVLCPVITCAEHIRTPHDFQTMNKETELIFSNSNTVGRTALLTYKCTGTDAKFAVIPATSTIGIRLPKYGSTVTTTKINELDEMTIGVLPSDAFRDNIKVYVSRDSITWSPALTGDSIDYSKGSIHVSLPRNNYYVRLTNTLGPSKDASLTTITYWQDHCNCFIYEP